ncbi:MAG: von Willebrand factor type A domain-containing protein, partial [Pseudomonadota bacterium]
MIDDDDDLNAILSANPPAPAPDAAKARARAAAVSAFDEAGAAAHAAEQEEKIATNLQGSRDALRQTGRRSGLMTLVRRLMMNISLPSTRTMMLGSASLAVVVIAVMSAQQAPQLDFNDAIAPEAVEPIQAEMTGGDGAADETVILAEEERGESVQLMSGAQSQSELGRALDQSADDGSDLDAEAPVGLALPSPQPTTEAPAELSAGVAPALAPPRPPQGGGLAQVPAAAGQSQLGAANVRSRTQQQTRAVQVGRLKSQDSDRAVASQEAARLQDGATLLSSRIENDVQRQALASDFKTEAEPTPNDTYRDQGRDQFDAFVPNPIVVAAENPVSTFSVDVDTASYAFMRSSLQSRVLPQKNAIRIEELINYFPYDYAGPDDREAPFAANVSIQPTPWNEQTQLMRIGIKGYELEQTEKPRSNLVFLLDTSGSMNSPDKLPLLIDSFSMLVDSLDPDDTVAIVVYAGSAGTVLEPTKVAEKGKILRALDRLRAGGSTAGGEGIRQAYQLAEANFDEEGINRVILATDGDFNVGIQDTEELKSYIERKRESGVFLSVLGFGRGNYNDALMQALAQNGNGTASYIDSLSEAQKVLVDEAASTLFPIAKDVKIQVEFNPAVIGEYRLIGFETRALRREDFKNDAI